MTNVTTSWFEVRTSLFPVSPIRKRNATKGHWSLSLNLCCLEVTHGHRCQKPRKLSKRLKQSTNATNRWQTGGEKAVPSQTQTQSSVPNSLNFHTESEAGGDYKSDRGIETWNARSPLTWTSVSHCLATDPEEVAQALIETDAERMADLGTRLAGKLPYAKVKA